jgi:hypothetical protein
LKEQLEVGLSGGFTFLLMPFLNLGVVSKAKTCHHFKTKSKNAIKYRYHVD